MGERGYLSLPAFLLPLGFLVKHTKTIGFTPLLQISFFLAGIASWANAGFMPTAIAPMLLLGN